MSPCYGPLLDSGGLFYGAPVLYMVYTWDLYKDSRLGPIPGDHGIYFGS